jgi:hypothetical protein
MGKNIVIDISEFSLIFHKYNFLSYKQVKKYYENQFEHKLPFRFE